MSLLEIEIGELCRTESSNCNGAQRRIAISDESSVYRRSEHDY